MAPKARERDRLSHDSAIGKQASTKIT